MIGEGGVGMRDCKVANYPHKVFACEGQKLGRAKAPQLHRPCDKVFSSGLCEGCGSRDYFSATTIDSILSMVQERVCTLQD